MEVADQEFCLALEHLSRSGIPFRHFLTTLDKESKLKGLKKTEGFLLTGASFYHISDVYVWQR
jgi:hypothetical protein